MSGRPGIVLCAPAAIRHDPLPGASISAHVLPGCADGIQAGANTIIVPARLVPAAAPDPAGQYTLQPVFLLWPAGQGSWLAYTLMSYTGDDLLYIRLPGTPVHGTPGNPDRRARWAADLSARHRAHRGQLNNHACWLRNLLPGLEAEHKFTLPPGTDIWDLAVTTHQHVRTGTIEGWICEHGNDGGFTQGDYISHLFAITRPATERGYIAFMPAIDGPGYFIRRKRYARDQVLRREDLTQAPELTAGPGDLPQVIRDRYGLTPAWGATYRRVRYNVMLESLRTGHVFSIMYDRCTAEHAADLTQAEVEYVRSRTLYVGSQRQILSQLSELRDWTRDLLTTSGITHTEDHMSKLTWLGDHQRHLPMPLCDLAETRTTCPTGRDHLLSMRAVTVDEHAQALHNIRARVRLRWPVAPDPSRQVRAVAASGSSLGKSVVGIQGVEFGRSMGTCRPELGPLLHMWGDEHWAADLKAGQGGPSV